jgi:PhnB protein
MLLSPYLIYNGDCEAAFRFYEKCDVGKIESMRSHAGSPAAADVPPEWLDKILHARLLVGDQVLMASDAPPGRYERPQGFSVMLHFKDPVQAERRFQALAENGTVTMPIQETFWAPRFGMLVDQFGIPWMINCERPAGAGDNDAAGK